LRSGKPAFIKLQIQLINTTNFKKQPAKKNQPENPKNAAQQSGRRLAADYMVLLSNK